MEEGLGAMGGSGRGWVGKRGADGEGGGMRLMLRNIKDWVNECFFLALAFPSYLSKNYRIFLYRYNNASNGDSRFCKPNSTPPSPRSTIQTITHH